MNRIVYGVTSDMSLPFYRGHASTLIRAGFEVIFLASPGAEMERFAAAESVQVVPVPIAREIAIWADIRSLWTLTMVLRRLRPTITNFGTPKAGLLGNIAAKITSIPCRVYTLHGLRFETAQGWKQRVLMMTERIACKSAHRVVCVSPSLRQRAIDFGLVTPDKAAVLANGTCNGVDVDRFLPTAENLRRAEELRRGLNLPKDVPVIGFVGRFTRDKGIPELVKAYQKLRSKYPELRLLLVGDFEEGDPVPEVVQTEITHDAQIVRPGFVADTSPYYHLMDVLVLPTYREGFPSAPLEAQAAGKAVATTNATGAIDSVVDGVTGILVPVGDADGLAAALDKLLIDPELCARMGRDGRERIERDFRPEKVWQAQVQMYRNLIEEKVGDKKSFPRRSLPEPWLKRAFDLLVASCALAILSPLLAMIALRIRLKLGSPILFRQRRTGLHAKLFTCLKFRTMTEARDDGGQLPPDADRLTPLGRFLRSTSLDELPELVNVIRGEMSLVGPRPLLPQYLDRYSQEQMRRHDVKPGITGWAQVNGRNALDWNRKFELDLWYVDHRSFWLDLHVLARTVLHVVHRKGISQAGHATMPEFVGMPNRGAEND